MVSVEKVRITGPSDEDDDALFFPNGASPVPQNVRLGHFVHSQWRSSRAQGNIEFFEAVHHSHYR